MMKQWVIFFLNGKEILRYTLADEMPGERTETISLLAYEKGVSESDICFAIVTR